ADSTSTRQNHGTRRVRESRPPLPLATAPGAATSCNRKRRVRWLQKKRNGRLTAALPPTRRERYIIGTRTTGVQPFGQPQQQHSMNDVVEYLKHQENVEVVERIK